MSLSVKFEVLVRFCVPHFFILFRAFGCSLLECTCTDSKDIGAFVPIQCSFQPVSWWIGSDNSILSDEGLRVWWGTIQRFWLLWWLFDQIRTHTDRVCLLLFSILAGYTGKRESKFVSRGGRCVPWEKQKRCEKRQEQYAFGLFLVLSRALMDKNLTKTGAVIRCETQFLLICVSSACKNLPSAASNPVGW